ncbi:MAG: F0F1 ATP synthase subunit A [Nitrospirae bacterium]|nr:F0F1 ATP synthase subunit A [Nitrospirota bacterium]
MKEAPLFTHYIPGLAKLPDHVTYSWLIMGILFAASFIASRSIRVLPTGIQNFFEMVVEGLINFMEDIIGHNSRQYLPLVGTLAFFILLSNLIGLVPGFLPPTSNINTTLACAIIVFFATHYYGVKAHGIGYLKHFIGPMWWLAPVMILVELISHLARVLSLSLRLFGNIYGEELVLLILVFLVPVIVPLPMMAIGIFTAIVQTFVFVLLSMFYIKLATEEAEEGH